MNHHIADTNQFMLLVCMLKKNSLNNFVAIFAEIVLVQVGLVLWRRVCGHCSRRRLGTQNWPISAL